MLLGDYEGNQDEFLNAVLEVFLICVYDKTEDPGRRWLVEETQGTDYSLSGLGQLRINLFKTENVRTELSFNYFLN